MNLGQAIKELRKAARLNQKQLAEMASVTQTAISQFEKGTRQPNDATLDNIAKALNVSVAGLYVRSIGTEDIALHQWGNPNAEFMLNSGKELILKSL